MDGDLDVARLSPYMRRHINFHAPRPGSTTPPIASTSMMRRRSAHLFAPQHDATVFVYGLRADAVAACELLQRVSIALGVLSRGDASASRARRSLKLLRPLSGSVVASYASRFAALAAPSAACRAAVALSSRLLCCAVKRASAQADRRATTRAECCHRWRPWWCAANRADRPPFRWTPAGQGSCGAAHAEARRDR